MSQGLVMDKESVPIPELKQTLAQLRLESFFEMAKGVGRF